MSRVAFVVPMLGRGGAERVVFNLVREFRKRDLEVLCVCLEKLGALGEELVGLGCRVECLERKAGYDVSAIWWLNRIFARFKPDIVNVHSYSVLLYVILSRLFSAKFKIVFTAHGLLYSDYFKKKRWQFYFAAKLLSGFISVDAAVAERHRQYVGWSGGIEVIANGIEPLIPDKLAGIKLREELGIPKDSYVFLAVGNIRPEKGIEDLLDAVKVLDGVRTREGFHVVIAGSMRDYTSYSGLMRDKCSDLGLSDIVHFIGHRTDMAGVYALGDAFILSSRSEGMPMVVLEALSAGLLVVATRVGGVTALLQGATGAILVDPREPRQLADAMSRIMKAEFGKHVVDIEYFRKTYSIEMMANQYLGYFRTLL